MTDEEKLMAFMIGGIAIIAMAIAIVFTACHEVIENGNAKRCAEYKYSCQEEEK